MARTGNYTTIKEAMDGASANSESPYTVYVKAGIYNENVTIPGNKPNIVFIGDGADKTIVTQVTAMPLAMEPCILGHSLSGPTDLVTFTNSAGPDDGPAAALVI
ncbi:hypothetical protein L1049_017725 [Liquidambar formosana]|uniref:Pectinesterase n=1 Tax=Liquidambar formosana TaxID=63359 RepID=A0AAP0S8W7_LIQFO